MEFIEVVKPGLLSTVQDLGRADYRIYGVSSSGAMDTLSLRLANILVGNPEGEAAIEITLIGPQLKFCSEGAIAITGADLEPTLNGNPMPMWKAIRVTSGDVLQFSPAKHGCRAYIAISGGIDVPSVMGSRSTFVRGGYGGVEGRSLRAGDLLKAGATAARINIGAAVGRILPFKYRPDYRQERPIRFIYGPQADAFTEASVRTLTANPYFIRTESDRMGYRLQGQALTHTSGADIISDYITVGSIQVPGDGQPIVLMSDCQVTGGYTKIGVVIGVDLPFLAQKKPGDSIMFEQIEIGLAQRLWREQEQLISLLRINNIR
jgi:antagonist of KipI